MSNFFDLTRNLLESSREIDHARDLNELAHEYAIKGDHQAAAMHHEAASTIHCKLKETATNPFSQKFHETMQSHHDAMRDLHSSHAVPVTEEAIDEKAIDAKGHKSDTGGLTQKGRDYYNRKTGGNLQAPVTKKPSELDPKGKAAARRRSFCARMSGVKGPMKKPNGEPTRKALALRKWNC